MPIYESEEITREELEKIRKRNVCAVCGGWLNMFLDPESGKAFIACNEWPRSHHEGIEKEASRYQKEGVASLNIPTRRELMTQEYGEVKTKALDKYINIAAITKRIATEIVETLWGTAPIIQKTKCVLLCQTYQLNPLMKHIYLVGYRRKKDGKFVLDGEGKPVLDWSIQIGIGATRLMAQRKHNYSYLDYTPRLATKMEIEKILGDTADPECVYGFTHIRDMNTGAECTGLRGIEKNASIKGQEKGNTHLNMACVRSERLCLDKQYPGEMPPQGLEVVDERFIDADYRVVDGETGEITESKPAPEPEPQPSQHWCSEHNCAFQKKTKYGKNYWSHPLLGGKWCNERKKEEAPAPAAEAVSESTEAEPAPVEDPEAEIKRDPDTIKTLNDLYKACHEDFKLQPDQVIKELGVSSPTDIADTPADCYRQIAKVR